MYVDLSKAKKLIPPPLPTVSTKLNPIPHHIKIQNFFWVPWGIGLSLVFTLGRGGGINLLALDKYQILASYFDYNWFKKFVVGGGWVGT